MDELDESAHIFAALTATFGAPTVGIVRQLHARAVEVLKPLISDADRITWDDIDHVINVWFAVRGSSEPTERERAASGVLLFTTYWIVNEQNRHPVNAFKIAHNWALMSETLRIGRDTRQTRKKFAARPRDPTIPARNERYRNMALEKLKANPALSGKRLSELIRADTGATLSAKEIAAIIRRVLPTPKRKRPSKVAG